MSHIQRAVSYQDLRSGLCVELQLVLQLILQVVSAACVSIVDLQPPQAVITAHSKDRQSLLLTAETGSHY